MTRLMSVFIMLCVLLISAVAVSLFGAGLFSSGAGQGASIAVFGLATVGMIALLLVTRGRRWSRLSHKHRSRVVVINSIY